jgi:hypothetical protein
MKAIGFNIGITLEYSDLFDEKTTVEGLLTGIDRKFLMDCASLFLSPKASRDFRNPKEYFHQLFCKENQKFVSECSGKLAEILAARDNRPVQILNDYSSLIFCEEALKVKCENSGLAIVEMEQRVFKAYILINEILNLKLNNINDQLNLNYSGSDRMAWFILLFSFHNQEVFNFDIYNVVIAQIKKAILLFEFLNSKPELTEHLEKFLRDHSSQSSIEYLRGILPLVFGSIKENQGFYTAKTSSQKDAEFLTNWAASSVEADFDFRNIRANPLYKIEENEYRILSPLFMCESLYNGLYFKLNTINSSLDKPNKLKNFRQFYTSNFSEKYLLNTIMRQLFEKKYVQFSGEQLDNDGISGAPDYYVRNGNKVFLFECKDVLINGSVKSAVDYLQLEKAIKEKFYKTDKAPKAIVQQINCIEKLLNMEHKYDKRLNPSNATYYPILITHYRMFDCPGFNKVLLEIFNSEIEQRNLSSDNIFPLTVINIDDLINYKSFFKNNLPELNKTIIEYHKYTTWNSKQKFRTVDEAENKLKSTYNSFSKFLEQKFKGQLRTPLKNEITDLLYETLID